MYGEDAASFLADLGSPVTWGLVSGLMIFDQPAEEIESSQVISSEFKVTFETAAWPGLKRDEILVIGGDGCGASYKLRTTPMAQGDGVFSVVSLSKVRS